MLVAIAEMWTDSLYLSFIFVGKIINVFIFVIKTFQVWLLRIMMSSIQRPGVFLKMWSEMFPIEVLYIYEQSFVHDRNQCQYQYINFTLPAFPYMFSCFDLRYSY